MTFGNLLFLAGQVFYAEWMGKDIIRDLLEDKLNMEEREK